MNRDRVIGFIFMLVGALLITLYSFLLFIASKEIQFTVIKYTVYLFILLISFILIYLGYTLITIPPPIHPNELRDLLKNVNNPQNKEYE